MRTYQLDTNVILRYLIGDDKQKVKLIQNIKSRAKAGEIDLLLTEPIILESAATLRNYFKYSREKISELLTILCSLDWLTVENKGIVISAIHDYETTGLDFSDCLLLARVKVFGHKIFTFDKKLMEIASRI